MIRSKSGAAALSIVSNSILIALKLAAGAITGSIAIVTEAIHSLIDLVASVIAFISVRKADEPADAEHPYGHEKVENLAATIEGILILVGAAVIVYEASHRLAAATISAVIESKATTPVISTKARPTRTPTEVSASVRRWAASPSSAAESCSLARR